MSGSAYSPQPAQHGATISAITADPKFQELVRTRNSLALILSIIMMAVYLGFIFLVALDKPLLATKFGGGTTTSLGIVLGLVVIVAAIILTGLYVLRANGRFDELTTAIVREHGR